MSSISEGVSSTLTSSAASSVPDGSAASSRTSATSAAATEVTKSHPLYRRWSYWELSRETQKTSGLWMERQKMLGTIGTVEEFWELVHFSPKILKVFGGESKYSRDEAACVSRSDGKGGKM